MTERFDDPKPHLADHALSGSGRSSGSALKLFIAYSHLDDRMREHFGNHLAAMQHQGLIQIWYDRLIEAADNWEGEANRAIEEADVVLLLISASFIRSPQCQKELKDALRLRGQNKSLPVPIILRPCDWEVVFNQPGYKTQALPRDNRSVAGGTWPNHDAAFAVIVRELRSLFERLHYSVKGR